MVELGPRCDNGRGCSYSALVAVVDYGKANTSSWILINGSDADLAGRVLHVRLAALRCDDKAIAEFPFQVC